MNAFSLFFLKNPALLYGSSLIFGFFFPYSLLPALSLFFFLTTRQKVILILFFCLSFAFLKIYFIFPEKPTKGSGHFCLTEIKKAKKRGYIYRGEMKEFISENKKVAAHVPVSFFSFSKLEGGNYKIDGILEPKNGYTNSIKPLIINNLSKQKIPALRFEAKLWFRNYLNQVMPHERSSVFLAGLVTGELQNPILSKEFEKRGLSHLLAVSGFHFAILATFLHFGLRNFFPAKSNAFFMAASLTLYFLFVGNGPSVQRAWVMAIFFLMGQLFERRGSSLNNLGIATLVAFIFNPISFYNAGFQLSYLATLGILMLYGPIKKCIESLLPKPKFLINALSICFAVHFAIVPLLFFFFHKLPLHGILYNLYFPLFVSLSFVLMILASFLHLFLPPLAMCLHFLNSHYTNLILKLLQLPLIPHKTLYVENVPSLVLTIYLTVVFGGAILLKHKKEESIPFL